MRNKKYTREELVKMEMDVLSPATKAVRTRHLLTTPMLPAGVDPLGSTRLKPLSEPIPLQSCSHQSKPKPAPQTAKEHFRIAAIKRRVENGESEIGPTQTRGGRPGIWIIDFVSGEDYRLEFSPAGIRELEYIRAGVSRQLI